jgi:xanthine dehydrogenase YagS FAD-binding subunit
MQPFQFHRAASLQDAVRTASSQPTAAFIAGGSDLLPLWKADVAHPTMIIDITQLPLALVELRGSDLALGALVTMSTAASHPLLLERCPAIVQALLASASPQVRNLATLGGNLLQRTRCSYFRHRALPCNKREPGSGCGALQGEHRQHAIFGTSNHCIAAHASDLAVALLVADARLRLYGPAGERHIHVSELLLPPAAQPHRDHTLEPGELITEILVPEAPWTRRSHYLKMRDRAAFEFALMSVAVGLGIEDGVVRSARIAAGGVGTVPWRLGACESLLIGQPAASDSLARAAQAAAEHAAPLTHNAFKATLLQRATLRALHTVLADQIESRS